MHISVCVKQGLPKVIKISMEKKLVRVLLPLFCTRPCTKSFYLVVKGSNVSANAFDDSRNNIPEQSIIFQEYYRRDARNTGLCNISATSLRICDKFQEVCFRTNSENRVSGYDCELKDNDIVFTSRKVSGNNESVSGGVQSTRDNLVRTNTFIKNINFTIQAILLACLQFPYLQQQQIATLKGSASYMAAVTLNAMTKAELAWWIKKNRIKQWPAYYSASLADTNADITHGSQTQTV